MPTLRLRVVSYLEDELWVAHSLEMDVIGVGGDLDSAIRELRENMEAQLSFSKAQDMNPFRSAPEEIQKLWDAANLSVLGLAVSSSDEFPRETGILEWSESQIGSLDSSSFQCA